MNKLGEETNDILYDSNNTFCSSLEYTTCLDRFRNILKPISDPSSEFEKTTGTTNGNTNKRCQNRYNSRNHLSDDTKYGKDSVKSPPEIICRRVTQDEVLGEVSEFDSEIIQLLGRCGRENIPERLANWLENTE